MSRAGGARAYQRKRDLLLADVLAWRRTNDLSRLANARKNFSQLFRLSSKSLDVKRVEVVISGWLAPQFQARLSKLRLRLGNPGYDVAVSRHNREDVARAYGWPNSRLGFQVRVSRNQATARGPFVIGVMRNDGRLMGIPVSNDHARERLGEQDLAGGDVVIAGRSSSREVGYVDAVTAAPRVDPRDARTWFAGFVREHPGIAYELADDTGVGPDAAAAASDILREFEEETWAARFALVAGVDVVSSPASLAVFEVTRPDRTPSTGDVVAVPTLRVRGDLALAEGSEATLPRVRQEWQTLEDIELQCGGTVLQKGRLIAYEAAADPSLHFVAGQWETVLGSASRPDRTLVKLLPVADDLVDEGILLSGRNDDNWYHWMIEYAPRALQVPEGIASDVPLLVSSRTPQAGRDALSQLSNRPVRLLDAAARQRVARLHVVAPPVQILDTTRVPWRHGLSVNPEALIALRERWRDPTPARFPSRVVLRRRSTRRGLLNESELIELAERFGFTAIDPLDLDWDGQRNLFSHADVVVGASGAVMANYLLMSAGSHVVAMTSRQLSDFVLPAAIAAIAGVSFRYVLGDSPVRLDSVPDRNLWLHSDFTVSRGALERALHDLPRQKTPQPAARN